MITVYILWGKSPEPGMRPTGYQFSTEAEANAFLLGVDEASGWMDYTVVDDDSPVTEMEDEE